MKRVSKCTVAWVMGAATFLAATSGAVGQTIMDDYIGGMYYNGGTIDTGTTDIMGDEDQFDIDRMEVDTDGSDLVIDIYSTYFDNIGASATQLGDLFFSNDGWNPYDPTSSDHYMNGEDWELALTLDDHTGGATSGVVSLFGVDSSNIELAENQGTNGYRWGQEVLYDGSGQSAITTGTWEIMNLGGTDEDDFIRFTIDYSSLGSIADSLGIRWSMTCANDIIEGAYSPVPEPATMILFGTGLVGLAGSSLRRRRRKQQ